MSAPYADSQLTRKDVDAMRGATLLEFGTNWCGHCRAAQPVIASALKDHPGVRHLRISDASGKRLGRSFTVKLWPTLILLQDGKEVARIVRPRDARALHEALVRVNADAGG